MIRWNKALRLVKISRGTWNSQLKCFISGRHSFITLKLVYEIGSRAHSVKTQCTADSIMNSAVEKIQNFSNFPQSFL